MSVHKNGKAPLAPRDYTSPVSNVIFKEIYLHFKKSNQRQK